MLDETPYNNVCLAVMANLQGFYREDGDIYLGRIDWKIRKIDLFLSKVYFVVILIRSVKFM